MRFQSLVPSSKSLVGSLALLMGLVGAAQAGTVSISDAFDASSQLMRVVSISAPNCVSQGSTLVRYNAVPFSVDVSGSYEFSLLQLDPGPGKLASLYLHTDAFNPNAGLASCLAGDNTGNPKEFEFDLAAGLTYIAVPFDDTFTQAGAAYTLTISGPGDIFIKSVPEPGSLALLAGALVALVGVRRPRPQAAG